ncbi:Pentatricopeptide repeat-containing protein [Drosera capensis]
MKNPAKRAAYTCTPGYAVGHIAVLVINGPNIAPSELGGASCTMHDVKLTSMRSYRNKSLYAGHFVKMAQNVQFIVAVLLVSVSLNSLSNTLAKDARGASRSIYTKPPEGTRKTIKTVVTRFGLDDSEMKVYSVEEYSIFGSQRSKADLTLVNPVSKWHQIRYLRFTTTCHVILAMNLRRHYHLLRRRYSTKYTAQITSTTPNGLHLAASVASASHHHDLDFDTRGYPLPRQDLICKITQILKSPFLDLHTYLDSLSLKTLTTTEASLILKSLNHSPHLSLQFFKFCESHFKNFKHEAFTYNRLIVALSRAADIEAIREVVGEMERGGVKGNISTVNIVMGAVGGVEGVEMGMRLARGWGLRLTGYTYKCAVQAYLRAMETEEAVRVYEVSKAYKVFEDMKRRHCEPDEFAYTVMIRMTGKTGKAEESLALFKEMLAKGFTPNSMAYNTIIQALSLGRMIEEMISLFHQMLENNCCPNEFTYSVILNALAAEGKLNRLDEVVDVSKEYMNKFIYAYLVRTLSKLGHQEKQLRRWIYSTKLKGIVTDTVMHNTVLSALGRLKQISHLDDLYAKMRRDGPSPDIFTYNILISSFGRAGEVAEAVKVCEELEESSCQPDVVSYNSLINALGKNGDVDEAYMRFKEMQEKGLTPDVVTFSTLFECFGKSGKVEMACRLLDEMIDMGCCQRSAQGSQSPEAEPYYRLDCQPPAVIELGQISGTGSPSSICKVSSFDFPVIMKYGWSLYAEHSLTMVRQYGVSIRLCLRKTRVGRLVALSRGCYGS